MVKARKAVGLLVCIGLIGAALIGVGVLRRSELLQPDSERTRTAVLARIPIGTDIQRTRSVMEGDGFECVRMHSGFTGDRPGGGPSVHYPAADILWCDSGDRTTWALVISKRWQIVFVEEDSQVARVAVSVGVTGL